MKPKKKPLLPVDIKLPERVLLEDGVILNPCSLSRK